jgi:NAD+ kinase
MPLKIAVFGYIQHSGIMPALKHVLAAVRKFDFTTYVEKDLYESAAKENFDVSGLQTFASSQDLDSSFDLFLSIGGDGTILRSVNYVKDTGIPVLGLNIGRLGFLANVQQDAFEKALEDLTHSQYSISRRSLIQMRSHPTYSGILEKSVALNEITISRRNTTSMIVIETWLNDEYLNAYWADGLIISTPTGSTGYSLSCGGPVISPDTNALVITPIAPHNLNARPLIVPDTMSIKLKVSGREPSYLVSLDSTIETVSNQTEIFIEKAPFHINMIELQGDSFFKTIRKKLLWGEDKRN